MPVEELLALVSWLGEVAAGYSRFGPPPALVGGPLNDGSIDKAATLARAAARPISDMRGDADYRRHLAAVYTKRAIEAAVDRAK